MPSSNSGGHEAAAHLVEVLVDLVALVGLAVDVADERDEREVVRAEAAVLDRLERGEALAKLVDLRVDLGVADRAAA